MKTIYTALIVLFILSCKSADKLIDKGRYDEAIDYVTNKIEGKKEKDDKLLVALEDAYLKANERDLAEIKYLKAKGQGKDFQRIYDLYRQLDRRQARIIPHLPLVGKSGYRPIFKIADYTTELLSSIENIKRYHYDKGVELLSISGKSSAREAYFNFDKTMFFDEEYNDVKSLLEESLQQGTIHVSVEHRNLDRSWGSWLIEEEMISWPFFDLNNFWTLFDYYLEEPQIDYLVVIELDNVAVSGNNEKSNTYTVNHEIEIDKTFLEMSKDQKDTTKVNIPTKKKVEVEATITEVFRKKSARLEGRIEIINIQKDALLYTEDISILEEFDGYSSSFKGDERALCAVPDFVVDHTCEAFPSNEGLLLDMMSVFQSVVFKEIDNFEFRPYN